MSAKKRTGSRLPAIVPRFLKNAVAIGAIPALSGCFASAPPVVAAYSRKYKKQRPVQPPADAGEPTPPVQPVVAAMMPPPLGTDAGVDAPAQKANKP